MNRFHLYNKTVISNLLLSKFVYNNERHIIKIKRTIISTIPRKLEPEVATLVFAAVFKKRACFSRAMEWRGGTYKLHQIKLTSRSVAALENLHQLSNLLLPFQLENKDYLVKLATHAELNWTAVKCRPSTQLNPLLFQYVLNDDTFDVSVKIQLTEPSIVDSLFVLRLFQLPLLVSIDN